MRKLTAVGVLVCAFALYGCGGQRGKAAQATASSSLTVPTAAAPGVLAWYPGSNVDGASVNAAPFALFNKPLDPATVNDTTFTLRSGSASGPLVAGVVSYEAGSNKAVFTPGAALANATWHYATITTGVRDAGGVALPSSLTWSFRTAAAPAASTTPPTPSASSPLPAATGVGTGTTISLKFGSAVSAASVSGTTFTLTGPSGLVAATAFFDASSNSAVLVPTAPLDAGAAYTATASTGITNPDGVPMAAAQTWSFTTAAGADTEAPAVFSVAPLNDAAAVATGATASALFTDAMDASTVNETTFTVQDVAGAVTYDAATRRAVFTPSAPLTRGVTHTATISGATDLAGNPVTPCSWSFTTQSLYSGYVSDIWNDYDGNIVTTQNAWSGNSNERGIALHWDVTPVGGAWQYQYAAVGNVKGVNKWIESIYLAAPQGFDPADLLPGWTFLEPVGGAMTRVGVVPPTSTATPAQTPVQTYAVLSSLSPTPLSITGTKWFSTNSSVRSNPGQMFVLTFRSPRAPVWGDVLLLSGTTAGCGQGTCAYPIAANAGFGVAVDGAVAPANGNHGGWALVPGPVVTATGPFLQSTTPATDATGVEVAAPIRATFSAPMDAATITPATFTVSGASGTVSYDAATRTATFTPSSALAYGSAYTARISARIQDAEGHPLEAPTSWTFHTGAPAAAPTVVSTIPAQSETAVAVSAPVTATFSCDMAAATINESAFTVASSGSMPGPVSGTVAYVAATRTATFTPATPLAAGTTYTAVLNADVRSAGGTALALTTWTFTTGGTTPGDTTPPTVTAYTPVPEGGATTVKVTSAITATFSEQVEGVSVATFTVNGVAGSVTYVPTPSIATFTPSAPLAPGRTYTATITSGVTDEAGNPLAAAATWTFTTEGTDDQTTSVRVKGRGCTSGGLGGATSLLALGVSALLRRRRRPSGR